MAFAAEVMSSARLDFAEILRSRWLVLCVTVYGALAAGFVLLGLRESSLFGFTGMGRVLFSLCHALVFVLPLVALAATSQVVNRARADGTLELVFSLPMGRTAYFGGLTLARVGVLVVPLATLLVLLAIVGRASTGDSIPWNLVARTVVVTASLLIAFAGLGLLISTAIRSETRAIVTALAAWAAAVALVDFGLIGLMLQWRIAPLTVLLIGALNPVQAARLALVSGVDAELPMLGPVGFFLSERIGANGLLLVGTLWPAIVGVGCWFLARRIFTRGDLV